MAVTFDVRPRRINRMTAPIAKLALEDGTVYTGTPSAPSGEVDGEVCLQHLDDRLPGNPHRPELSRPDRHDDLSPRSATTASIREDVESGQPHLAGFVVRELSRRASNFRAEGELDDYLAAAGIVGLAGIDTRALVRRIRIRGAMKGVLSTIDLDDASLVAKAQASRGLVGRIWCARWCRTARRAGTSVSIRWRIRGAVESDARRVRLIARMSWRSITA